MSSLLPRDPVHGSPRNRPIPGGGQVLPNITSAARTGRHVPPEFRERTPAVDASVALTCARLHAPEPRAGRDALIAATAIGHDMKIVTGNRADFEATEVALIDPWTETWPDAAGLRSGVRFDAV